jgi:NADH-quinone oxidoreductase subunit J
MTMALDVFILTVMIIAALWAAMTRSLLRAAIALAFTSAVVSIMMFQLGAPLAAVFELSVCAGLITVLFISTISMTEPRTPEEKVMHRHERFQRFRFLPVIIVAIGIVLSLLAVKVNIALPPPEMETSVRNVLWSGRPLDMIGQVIILLAGVFGVIILFKETEK